MLAKNVMIVLALFMQYMYRRQGMLLVELIQFSPSSVIGTPVCSEKLYTFYAEHFQMFQLATRPCTECAIDVGKGGHRSRIHSKNRN